MTTSTLVPDLRPVARAASFARTRIWTMAVWVSMAVWSAVTFAIVRSAFLHFREGRFDLGNMVQAVSNTGEGRLLEITNGATGEQMVRLGAHADPFLALLAPLWLLWPSPLVLALAQVVVVALGALPVLWLGRRHLGSEAAAGVLALAYLAYPWIATSAVGAIHPVTFAITLLLFAIWCLDTDRLGLFWVFALLTMSTGELMGLPVLGLGVWFALAHGRRLAGAAIAGAGAAWTVLAIFVVVPAFAGQESMFYGFYETVGGSPQGVVRTLVTDPLTVLGALVEAHDIVYLLWLGVPLLGLFLLSPGLAAVAFPQLLANGLSDFRSMTDPRYHSVAAIVPFLVAATVLGLSRVRPERRAGLATAVLLISGVLSLAVGPWARAVGGAPLGGAEYLPAERVAALSEAVALVPADVAVTTSNSAGAHLSARRYVYSVPYLRRAEWVVLDTGDPWVVSRDSPILYPRPAVVRRFLERLQADPAWETVYERSGVAVLRRS